MTCHIKQLIHKMEAQLFHESIELKIIDKIINKLHDHDEEYKVGQKVVKKRHKM